MFRRAAVGSTPTRKKRSRPESTPVRVGVGVRLSRMRHGRGWADRRLRSSVRLSRSCVRLCPDTVACTSSVSAIGGDKEDVYNDRKGGKREEGRKMIDEIGKSGAWRSTMRWTVSCREEMLSATTRVLRGLVLMTSASLC